ncbi:MAG TPA: hypothetical protein VGN26_12045 [Armatimonadota bacterium]|jgi:hypothetical protein
MGSTRDLSFPVWEDGLGPPIVFLLGGKVGNRVHESDITSAGPTAAQVSAAL